MNFSASDFATLKWSLLTFLLALSLGSAAIWLSDDYVSTALAQRQKAQRQMNETRSRLLNLQSDLDNMDTYAQEYGNLAKNGVFASELRLDWMEGLEKLRQQRLVPTFRYTISPQQNYVPNPPRDTGNHELNYSALSLQLDLLHEQQLLRFLAALRNDLPGRFMLDHCTLERNATGSRLPLKAECGGGWLTLKSRNASS